MKTISRYLLTLVALFAMTAGAWADETATITLTSGQTVKTYEDVTLPWSTTAEILKEVVTDINFNININAISGGDGKVVKYGNENFTVTGTFSGEATVTVTYNMSSSATITVTAPGPLLTLNEAKTEATMESMPTSDVTIDYELVRDMSVQMQAQVGDDPAKEPRYRVQWNGESWVPTDMNYEQVRALFSVNDLIEKQALGMQNYLVNIYAVDAEGQPTGNAMDFQTFTFAPGRYAVTASAPQGIAYEGTTAPSNIFELFMGYEITVGAGEYATFYKDEALYTEDEYAELYTISSVSDTEAVLSDAVKIMPKNTPMLIFNKGTEAKTFILIPTEDDADEVEAAAAFRGTLEEKEMPASSATRDFYVCTGKAFEWVRDAGTIAANRCWLQIGEQVAAARAMTRSIVGGGNTTNMDDVRWQMEDGNYYDLQGRKVEKPNRKGIYIHNGRKVVVH